MTSVASKRPWGSFTADALVVTADEHCDLQGAQQSRRPGAAARSNAPPYLFLNPDDTQAPDKEIQKRGLKPACP